MKQPRFSIHDAFEEENDEAIRVYGSTVVSNVGRSANSSSGNNNVGASNNVTNNPASNDLSSTCDPRSVLKSIQSTRNLPNT